MLPQRRKREPIGIRPCAWIRCAGHLQWIRGFSCILCGMPGHECRGRIIAAHCRLGTDGCGSEKPSDIWVNSMCEGAHDLQHDIGEPEFQRRFGIDLKRKAYAFAKASPHRMKWIDHPEWIRAPERLAA
jgi:hypothetical protein